MPRTSQITVNSKEPLKVSMLEALWVKDPQVVYTMLSRLNMRLEVYNGPPYFSVVKGDKND